LGETLLGWLLLISFLVAAAVTVPVAVMASVERTLCPLCRYDLRGLPPSGTCPECGGYYAEKVVVRRRWDFRWERLPGIAAAMLTAAISPPIAAVAHAAIYVLANGWTWDASWYQTMERNFEGVPLLALPFFLNACTLVANASGFKFWWELTVSVAMGLLASGALAAAYWYHIRIADISVVLVVLYANIFVLMIFGRFLVRGSIPEPVLRLVKKVLAVWRELSSKFPRPPQPPV